jgi:hypothetical protein
MLCSYLPYRQNPTFHKVRNENRVDLDDPIIYVVVLIDFRLNLEMANVVLLSVSTSTLSRVNLIKKIPLVGQSYLARLAL